MNVLPASNLSCSILFWTSISGAVTVSCVVVDSNEVVSFDAGQ